MVDNPTLTPADEAMRQVAVEMGVEETFHPAPVGVFFGPPGSAPGALSPTRTSEARGRPGGPAANAANA